jgi:hypothetical protein
MKYLLHAIIFCFLTMSLVPVATAQFTTLNPQGTVTGNKDTQSGTVAGQKDPNTGTAVGGGSSLSLKNPIQAKSIGALFQAIIDIVLVFAIPVVVFFIILAGFRYVTARGNGHTIEEAHMALLYALIGGVLILGARVLIEVISGTVDAIKG